ncbi:phosphodiester glycosidase family protein [Arenibaculum pallidiluteum]|uniref:phosphodiester glycosidase family protein n=1 Tax=Arenibaculum pallidiluteum TaxID=2812559 RepID=UPI001A979D60|nr:phosphodiester glycosidase family protein [Arenibaculum pallidiluteum]
MPRAAGFTRLALAALLGVPCPAGAEVVSRAPGIEVVRETIPRADGGTAELLLARISPGRILARVSGPGEVGEDVGTAWSVTINGSYFDAQRRPVYLLRAGEREIAPLRRGGNAVFWCAGGRCAIQRSTVFDPRAQRDLAVQSSPRLLAGGRPTVGVRGAEVVDARAGLGITTHGDVLVFATPPQAWAGLSFEGLRDHLAKRHAASDILMLDGGSSARLSIRVGSETFRNGLLARNVPYSLVFSAR